MARVTRMSAAGNTFIVWDTKAQPAPMESRPGIVRSLCSGFTGFYTDGLFFVEDDPQGQCDFVWDFYNSDGSSAEMCGNAARCAALFFSERRQLGKNTVTFRTRAGVVSGAVHESHVVDIIMPKLNREGAFLPIRLEGRWLEFFFVNTGVPHLVVEGEPDEDLARTLRKSPELGSSGANITFYNEVGPGDVEAVTFERGVENFTLACGTGAVAAAAFSLLKNPLLKVHSVEMPGGSLRVEWKSPLQATLTGPTQFDFDLVLQEGAL